MASFASNPVVLEAYLAFDFVYEKSSFTPAERQIAWPRDLSRFSARVRQCLCDCQL